MSRRHSTSERWGFSDEDLGQLGSPNAVCFEAAMALLFFVAIAVALVHILDNFAG